LASAWIRPRILGTALAIVGPRSVNTGPGAQVCLVDHFSSCPRLPDLDPRDAGKQPDGSGGLWPKADSCR